MERERMRGGRGLEHLAKTVDHIFVIMHCLVIKEILFTSYYVHPWIYFLITPAFSIAEDRLSCYKN